MGSPRDSRGCSRDEKAPCPGGGHFVTRVPLGVVLPLVANRRLCRPAGGPREAITHHEVVAALAGRFDLVYAVAMTKAQQCTHLGEIRKVKPHTAGCEECLKIGQSWVHLRLCLECGHVGCCDSSIGKHATKHFHATKHAIMQSHEPGESWGWCYVDEIMLDLD